jgi:hypothetical protein
VVKGWRSYRSSSDPLAWLLCGASFLNVVNGQLGPTTNLGFTVFGAGLCLAAANEPEPVPGEELPDSDGDSGEGESEGTAEGEGEGEGGESTEAGESAANIEQGP